MTHHPPAGFRLAAVHCGVKQDASKEDLTLVVCDRDAAAAGVYTQNLVCAAPVLLDRQRTPAKNIRVVVVNSGNANACTGERGWGDAVKMAELAARAVGAAPEQALVMSTGVIGVYLPMDRIANGIQAAADRLSSSDQSLLAAARGITTTDKGPKIASRELLLGGKTRRLTGFCKGAGMIGPNMATMLCLVMTDAPLTPTDAHLSLVAAIEQSFNCISVEGHTSTNDTALLLSVGAESEPALADAELEQFQSVLTELCVELAKMIPSDGEGASHLIEIDIRGCRTRDDARQIAKTVGESALVKTAVAGNDPNWGRIVSAAGYAGAPFDPGQVTLHVNGFLLYRNGAPAPFDAAKVSASMRENFETKVVLEFREGDAGLTFWTSDLTTEYIHINADYHT
jgi:glutamate N-acetyltransferase/amino-acid N-acetyltransferase